MANMIMLQGTSSNVGKSVLTAALCRILLQEGLKVAPFKAQNMALNSYVTSSGGEMGRAQVVQAEACKIAPDVLMNPILLKPTQPASSQVIVLGKPIGNLSAVDYHRKFKETAWKVICASLEELKNNYEVLVIEGAGSPAEVNLKANDIVNMRVARELNSPVLLVADIDRGGALASIVGTLELLEDEERDLIKGIIINKFRGDIDLLTPAIEFLEHKTHKPVLGVIPYFTEFRIPEEDSVAIENFNTAYTGNEKLDIAVINLPHIANFTDFDALSAERDVELRYVKEAAALGKPDLIIIPGSKSTIADMTYLCKSGLAEKIKSLAFDGIPVIGICGGFQILGQRLLDPHRTESELECCTGLALLDIETVFATNKITSLVKGRVKYESGLLKGCNDFLITGYEIHMGTTKVNKKIASPFLLEERSNQNITAFDGAIAESGNVLGTYLHGIFDNDLLRRQMINNIRQKKGWESLAYTGLDIKEQRDKDLDKLAEHVRKNLDVKLLLQIMGL
ncbi:MAG: cobyric acid synthase [Peptococcaceae bacterium]